MTLAERRVNSLVSVLIISTTCLLTAWNIRPPVPIDTMPQSHQLVPESRVRVVRVVSKM